MESAASVREVKKPADNAKQRGQPPALTESGPFVRADVDWTPGTSDAKRRQRVQLFCQSIIFGKKGPVGDWSGGPMNAKNERPPVRRSAGLLLHPTSLPGPYGIGDLGPAAYAWVDALAAARQTWWQILPLGPTGYGDSPYQCFSAFAGNPYLISPELLVQRRPAQGGRPGERAFSGAIRSISGAVIPFKVALLALAVGELPAGRRRRCVRRSRSSASRRRAGSTITLCSWPSRTRTAGPELARLAARADAARAGRPGGRPPPAGRAVGLHQFRQFLFFRQWNELKHYANSRGIHLIGDVPIFVSSDSADVWANPELFLLDEDRQPTVVAGVPPDYFSRDRPALGQSALRLGGPKQTQLRLVDRPSAGHAGAGRHGAARSFPRLRGVLGNPGRASRRRRIGRWVKGPGADFLRGIGEGAGRSAADRRGPRRSSRRRWSDLRDQFDLPGMRILQFAFGDEPNDRFLPHNYEPQHGRLHRHARQRHDRGWYTTLPEHDAVTCPLPAARRQRHRLGPDPPGLGFGGRLRPRAAARRAEPGHARHG